ncbi:MAG: hypothetical protein J1F60_02200 [Oscillospiraceae bacterium]|nr:hypothetical protein [Oscillospiraceae bacterium]
MMYFKNNISYSAVAAHYGISTERVRQIIDKQIRKLCLPTRLNVLKLGLNKYYYLQKIEDNKKGFDRACKAFYDTIKTMDTDVIYYTEDELSNIPIEEMELTVRSFSCLKRAGINTVGDIIEKGETELKKVRNLGVKGYNEIVDTLIMRYGESEKNWRKSENDC